jgi:hypothetical protein
METKKKNILRSHRKHTKAVYAATFLPSLAYVATGADDIVFKLAGI